MVDEANCEHGGFRPVPWHGMQNEKVKLSLVTVLKIITICAMEQTHSDLS